MLDFSTQGTSRFDGSIAAGSRVRVQIFGGLASDDATGIGGPVEVRVRLTDARGTARDVACATAQMWPSS